MDWYIIIIAITGGFIAGFINTLAGNGSAITLTILTEVIGLPGNLANGTNRIGIMAQGLVSTPVFWRKRKQAILRGKYIILWIVIGAIPGIIMAVLVSNQQFKTIFSYLMLILLCVVLIKPSRWLRETDTTYQLNRYIFIPLFLSIGFYAGFIQMGMGVIFLTVMVLLAKYDLIDSNAIKNVVVTLLTLLAIFIFQWNGMIDWKVGLTIAIGQSLGGWVSAHFATRFVNASLWAYRILVFMMILAVVKLFNLHHYFLLYLLNS